MPFPELALAKRFGLVPRSFDALSLATGAWPNLMKLARRTATALAATLVPPKTPLLLTQPGLIDRYQLVELLRSVVEAAKDDAAEPILLPVPGHERGVPRVRSSSCRVAQLGRGGLSRSMVLTTARSRSSPCDPSKWRWDPHHGTDVM
jgi:hypothetical protein